MIGKAVLISVFIGSAAASQATGKLTYPQYQFLVEKHSTLQGLDKNLVWAVMGRESSGDPRALSHKNARGLMQVIPPTAARMGVNPKYLYDPEQNIIAGTRYLRYLTKYFNGNLDFILAGYNAGEGAVNKYRGIPPYPETKKYVKNVKYRYARLSGRNIPNMDVTPEYARPKSENSGLMVYTSWINGEKVNSKTVTNNKPVKIVKTVRVKDVLKTVHMVETKPVRAKTNTYGFVQTLDENGNFVSL